MTQEELNREKARQIGKAKVSVSYLEHSMRALVDLRVKHAKEVEVWHRILQDNGKAIDRLQRAANKLRRQRDEALLLLNKEDNDDQS